MDLQAPAIKEPYAAPDQYRPYLWRATKIFLAGCLLMLVIKLFDLPKPLLLTLGTTCLISFAVNWAPMLWAPRSAEVKLRQGCFTWITGTVLVLGAVYHLDRAGWLWFTLTGYDQAPAEDFAASVDLAEEDFVQHHASFTIDSRVANRLLLRKGEYEFRKTIVIPRGSALMIEPGANLRFGAGCSLISYSPILARGTPGEPILFAALTPWLKWGVVGVIGADKSVFEHVCFENGRRAMVNNVTLPGCLSLIDSDAEIRHSQFRNLFGKDGVYVCRAEVFIYDNIFQDIYKDGLDLDAGRGEISHNRFINCHDEGIDLSENLDVQVHHNVVLDAKGGRIAAEYYLDEIRSLNTLGYIHDNS